MEQKIVLEIINKCEELYDSIPLERLNTWNFLIEVNHIVSQYDGVDCLIHTNFANGGVTQSLCVITDWQPGALAFQSDDGDLPILRLVFPEEYHSFMESTRHIFDVQYPPIPKR